MFIQNLASKVQQLELRQSQSLIKAIILLQLLWNFVLNRIFPDLNHPTWIMILSTFLCGAILFGSYRLSKKEGSASYSLFATAVILLMQTIYLGELNSWSVIYLISIYVILTFTLLHLSYRQTTYAWTVIYCAVTAFLAIKGVPQISTQFLLFIATTSLSVSLVSVIFRKTIFQELLRTDEFGVKIFQTMQEGIIIFNKQGELLSYNQVARAVFDRGGLDTRKMTVKNILTQTYDAQDADVAVGVDPIVLCHTQGMTFNHIEVKLNSTDQKNLWLMMNIVPLKDEEQIEGPYSVLVTLQDMTALTENKLIIEEQDRMLSVKARFTALGEMASGIAHEINNPLAIITGRVSQIRRVVQGSTVEKQALGLLDKIDDTIKRISRIIHSMKSLSREGTNDPFESANLKHIIDDTLVLVKEKLEKTGIALTVDIDPNIKLECRPSQLSQVILNMLYNSKDAIENLTEKWIQLSATELQDKVILKVVDSGNGIPLDVQKKIMQPFFTTKEVGKGTGLGLSISTSIIRDHQGEIQIDSTNMNTCFVIILPRHQSQHQSAA